MRRRPQPTVIGHLRRGAYCELCEITELVARHSIFMILTSREQRGAMFVIDAQRHRHAVPILGPMRRAYRQVHSIAGAQIILVAVGLPILAIDGAIPAHHVELLQFSFRHQRLVGVIECKYS